MAKRYRKNIAKYRRPAGKIFIIGAGFKFSVHNFKVIALEAAFAVFDWCWLAAIVGGLTVIPVTIGGLGIREASLVGLLGFFKIMPEQALALSFSFFLVQLILAAIGGLIEIRRTKIYKFSENKI